MNKTDKYKLVLLTVINSGVDSVLKHFEVSNPDLVKSLGNVHAYTKYRMTDIIGKNIKTARWSHRRLREWRDELNGSDHDMNITTLVACSYQAAVHLNDIDDHVAEILLPLEKLSDFFHIGVKSTDNYVRADETLEPLYNRIGFKP